MVTDYGVMCFCICISGRGNICKFVIEEGGVMGFLQTVLAVVVANLIIVGLIVFALNYWCKK